MWTQFLLQNLHFSIFVFTSLSFFTVFWLYLDAFTERKTLKEAYKFFGYLLISISFLVSATQINPLTTISSISVLVRNIGYLILLLGLITDPLIPKPSLSVAFFSGYYNINFLAPVLSTFVAWYYLRRSTIGLENHTKRVTMSFFGYSLFEIINLSSHFQSTKNIDLYKLVSDYSPLWTLSHVILFASSVILIKWSFSYLLKRISTQLFIIFTCTIIGIFLTTTVSFSYLLLKNISNETLSRLNTDVAVLSYALETKKNENQTITNVLSQNTDIINYLVSNDKTSLANLSEKLLISQKLSQLLITNDSGVVLSRGENREKVGDSISNNILFKQAQTGKSVSTLNSLPGVLAPKIQIQSASPIYKDNKFIGTIVSSIDLDNTFLDGIKKTTGLEISIFGESTLSASTLTDINSQNRPIGIKNSNQDVINQVLTLGKNYQGLIKMLNTDYFAVYQPITNINNEIIGMLLASKPASSIIETANQSTSMTFLFTTILIVVAFFPAYLISRYLTNQIT